MSNVTKSENKFPRDLEIVTLNQVRLLNQVPLNQVKLTLQKPVKIWDQRNLDVKSEMLLNQVTKRRLSTVSTYIVLSSDWRRGR